MFTNKAGPMVLAAGVSAFVLALSGCKDNNTTIYSGGTPIPSNSFIVTSSGRLLGFDVLAQGQAQTVGTVSGLAAGETLRGVAYRPANGLLYALASSAATAHLYTIDTTTAVATQVSTLAADATDTTAPYTTLSGASFGLDFNPVPDRLRVVSNTGQNLRINVDTGATITDTALNGATAGATGLGYTNNFSAACRTSLFAIDPATDRVYAQNPPNDGVLTSVGPLGLDVTSVAGLDFFTDATGANTAYAVLNSASGTALYIVSTATGGALNTGAITLNAGETAIAFATRPVSAAVPIAQAAGELVGLTAGNRLVSFQRASPAKVCTNAAVTGLPTGVNLLGIDVRPSTGALIALGSNGSSSSLYSLTTAGAATSVCTLAADPADTTLPYPGLFGSNFGVGFNPVPDRLRVISDTGQNLRVNPNAASGLCAVTTDTVISGAGAPVVTGVGYTNAIPAAGTTTLFGIDSSNDTLVRVGADPANGIAGDPGNPNSGVATTIGALGVGDVTAANGFVIDGRLNTALAALQIGAATSSSLYTVNLATGAATSSGSIGGGAPLLGLALTGGTTLRVYGLTFDNHLVSFTQTGNVLTPNALTDLTITGLNASENLLGIDFRPATATLYGLGSAGRVYVVNTTTGLATLSSTLAADAVNDPTPTFAGLVAGATYGLDFNPTVDRLRIVDSSGNNLRVNVSTGATITDTNLAGNTGPVTEVAYTNSFAGATTTTLYDVDNTTLYIQNPPNNGTLTTVGPLGVTAQGDIGFDIAGGANGLVLAAIRTAAGAGPSDLYRVNLATGAATPVNAAAGASTIGTAATQQIRSIAVDVR